MRDNPFPGRNILPQNALRVYLSTPLNGCSSRQVPCKHLLGGKCLEL